MINVMAWLLKVQAFKFDKASRVAPIFYLESVIALILDYALFDVSLGVIPLLGILIVIVMFALKMIIAYKN